MNLRMFLEDVSVREIAAVLLYDIQCHAIYMFEVSVMSNCKDEPGNT